MQISCIPDQDRSGRSEAERVERLHTSIRAVPPETTLRHAKAWAERAGIRSVRDVTAQDCLGVPIFVSERRPASTCPASTCYAFGKGRVAVESEVGAYMEAIEGYFSEPGIGDVEMQLGRPADLSGIRAGCDPLLEFAPKFDCRADPDRPLLLARAEDVESGAAGWVPAELAFNPPPPGLDHALYGATGNGLASGNSALEAGIHALYELIERDIWSTEFIRNRAARVAESDLPAHIREIAAAAAGNGLRLMIRHVPNDYGIPFFAAFLFDPARIESRLFNGGWGCHRTREVALTRAVTEAAQSRLAFLLGLREAKPVDPDRLRAEIRAISRDTPAIRFPEVPELPPAPSLAAEWQGALRCLRRVIDRPVYRIAYTPPDAPLQVVRLIVPLLEHFTPSTKRMGPRLRAEVEALAGSSAHAASR